MRYVTLRIATDGDPLHTIPTEALPPPVDRGPIHRIELLEDGSVAMVRTVDGDLPAYRSVLANEEDVYDFSLPGQVDGHAFLHFEPTESTRALLEWRRRYPFVVGMPVEFDGDDPVVTLIGDVSKFSIATASLPDEVTYEVFETGRFVPQLPAPFRDLTERQREILATAIDLGYYENPRGATQADVADALSLSSGTVGDHLRNIEAHVFSRASGSLRRGRDTS